MMRLGQSILSKALVVFALSYGFIACNNDDDLEPISAEAGTSFLDIENEGYVVELNAVPAEDGLIGTWRIYTGDNGHFDDVNDPKTNFRGDPGQKYLLGWEISDGDRYEASTIDVSFKAMEPVITTIAQDTLWGYVSLYLRAEEPKFGATGKWEILSGDNGRIENDTLYNAEFIGVADEEYTVSWILSYGNAEESVDISFVTDEFTADAGEDNLDVKTAGDEFKYYTLTAILPAGSLGTWEVLEGDSGTILTQGNPNTLFEGIADEPYVLKWTVELDGVTAIDTVNVKFRDKHGLWEDTDGQTYKYCEINGLEWMSENYNYNYDPGVGSLYYGYADRSVIVDGEAVESDEDQKKYGRLYNWEAAVAAAPEGWRLPTDDEIDELFISLGGYAYADAKIKEGGSSGFDLGYGGLFWRYSSNDEYYRNTFEGIDSWGYYWTSTYNESLGIAGVYLINSDSNVPGNSALGITTFNASVRYVRDIE